MERKEGGEEEVGGELEGGVLEKSLGASSLSRGSLNPPGNLKIFIILKYSEKYFSKIFCFLDFSSFFVRRLVGGGIFRQIKYLAHH